MKREVWFKFVFADGTVCITRGFSKWELKVEEQKHGKLISKTPAK